MFCVNCGKPATLVENCVNGRTFCTVLCQANMRDVNHLRVRVVTWNMGDNQKSRRQWEKELVQWDGLFSDKQNSFDILLVTVQEDQSNDTFGSAIENSFDGRFVKFKVSSKSLSLGKHTKYFVHSYIFVKTNFLVQKRDVSVVDSLCLKQKFKVCTKSTTGIALSMDNLEIVFMGSHFPVDPQNTKDMGYAERIRAADSSFKDVYVPMVKGKPKFIAFWAGDFNFRNMGNGDQMDQARKKGHFGAFKEHSISFPPTCKMKTDGTCNRPQSDTEKVPGCYNPSRLPSHCDRILYESKGIRNLMPLRYTAYGDPPAIQASDHNLVYADFLVDL